MGWADPREDGVRCYAPSGRPDRQDPPAGDVRQPLLRRQEAEPAVHGGEHLGLRRLRRRPGRAEAVNERSLVREGPTRSDRGYTQRSWLARREVREGSIRDRPSCPRPARPSELFDSGVAAGGLGTAKEGDRARPRIRIGTRSPQCLHVRNIQGRLTMKRHLLATAVLAVTASVLGYAPPSLAVDPSRIENADKNPNDWLTYHGSYKSWHYSALDQINTSTSRTSRSPGCTRRVASPAACSRSRSWPTACSTTPAPTAACSRSTPRPAR